MNKNKKTIIAVIAVVLIICVGYVIYRLFITPDHNQNGNSKTPTSTVDVTGSLVRNNPGLKPNTWYVVYEQPGSPALSLELSFNAGSTCVVNDSEINCSKLDVLNGQHVQVKGVRTNSIIQVQEIVTSGQTDQIQVATPQPNEKIKSPYSITGQARGKWFFEATFPIELSDSQGHTITSTIAQAQSDWMTENFVPFKATLNFHITTTTRAEIILKKDNPSGLPQNDAQIRVPIILEPTTTSLRNVQLYYYNPNNDKDEQGNILCSRKGLVAVQRTMLRTTTPIQDTIRLLLKGELAPQEKAQGITTEYPLSGVELTNASLSSGKALTLTFNDPQNKTSGGSCRVSVLWFQIEQTALQFPEVKKVEFRPEELFQP